MTIVILLTVFLFFIIIIKNFACEKRKETLLNVRKNQINLRDNPLKKTIENSINKNANITKKIKIESLCKQAGYNYTYGEFVMMSIFLAIFIPIFLLFFTYNIPLAIIIAFISYGIPKSMMKKRRTKRKQMLEKQIGAFLDIITERYKHNSDLNANIVESLESFRGQEPFYSELLKIVKLITYSGYSPSMALEELYDSTGNKYISQFKDSYNICKDLPSEESKTKVLEQARQMYEVDRKLMDEMKEKISGPVGTCYVVLAFIPGVMIYQIFMSEGYIDLLLNDGIGKAGLVIIVVIILAINWFIKNKINAPLVDE